MFRYLPNPGGTNAILQLSRSIGAISVPPLSQFFNLRGARDSTESGRINRKGMGEKNDGVSCPIAGFLS